MSRRARAVLFGAIVTTLGGRATTALAQTNILSPSDFIIAIDRDSYPPAENPGNLIDGNPASKYLNFGKLNTGFIVVPNNSSIVHSFTLTTANDQPPRDPASYQLFGTTSPVVSMDNDRGNAEPWTLIQAGDLSLSDVRATASTVDVVNSTSYSAYKMIFPTVKDAVSANSMQVAEAQLYTATAAGGAPILAAGNRILAVASDGSQSNHPAAEGPQQAIDRSTGTKYLNFGRENAGLIITPAAGATTVRGLRLTTAGDAAARDPSAYQLFGTNDAVTDVDNSPGNRENWVLIASGAINLPGDPVANDHRNEAGDIISFANETPYKSYRIVFTENKGPDTAANSIQFSELELFSSVPEPGTAGVLAAGALIAGVSRRRRRNA
jgi:hypothetical protein